MEKGCGDVCVKVEDIYVLENCSGFVQKFLCKARDRGECGI